MEQLKVKKNLQYWASERRKYHDNRNLETIDRLEKLCENDLERIIRNPKCYATWIDNGKVNRLEKSSKNNSTKAKSNETGISRRITVSDLDWKLKEGEGQNQVCCNIQLILENAK